MLMNTSSSENGASRTRSTADALRAERRLDGAPAPLDVVVDDDVQTIAEQRHAPAVHRLLQPIGGALRIVDVQFEQMAALAALDRGRRAFGDQFAGHHQAETIALLGLFEVVRRDQDGGAGVGQAVDQPPERTAGDRVDARGRLVEKQHARLVHDRGAEGDALLPAARQAADQLMFLALRDRQTRAPSASSRRARSAGTP